MDVALFVSPVFLLSIGIGLYKLIRPTNHITFRSLPEIWVLGTSSYILPVTILSIMFGISLQLITFLHHIISGLVLLYLIIEVLNTDLKELPEIKVQSLKWYHWLFLIISLEIIFLQLILPLRGWDALELYIPDAYFFFLTDQYPVGQNPFTFFPLFKAPVNSLLHTHQLFLADKLSISVIPALFFIFTGIIIINLMDQINLPEVIQYSTALIYLLSPMIYIHILEFAYYQDHVLAFYFGYTLVNLMRTSEDTNPFLIGVGFSMAILSKISGFALFAIVIGYFIHQNLDRKISIGYSSLLFVFLMLKSLTSGYVQYLVALIPLMVVLWYLPKQEITYRREFMIKVLVIPTIVGFLWIYRLTQFPDVAQGLQDTYFQLGNFQARLYQWSGQITQIYLENNHQVNIVTILFVYFLNYAFIPTLFLFKGLGLKKSYQKYPQILYWFILFFGFWLTYHGPVSMRYIQPAIIPMFAIIGLGLHSVLTRFSDLTLSRLPILLVLIQGPLYFYPLVPLSLVFESFHYRFYLNQASVFLGLIYLVLFTISFVKITENLQWITSRRWSEVVTWLLLVLIILIPIAAQTSILIQSKGNIDIAQQQLLNDNRYTVDQLADFVQLTFDPTQDKLIGVNIPGLTVKSTIPFIDLFIIQSELEALDTGIKLLENAVYNDLLANNITAVITLTPDHAYFPSFNKTYVPEYFFLQQPQPQSTSLIFANTEFMVWEILT